MDHLMLHHIFGTKSSDKVPEYWIDSPSQSFSGKGFFYDVLIEGKQERFWLEPKNQILSPSFHLVVNDELNSTILDHSIRDEHCLYQGYSITHNGSTIALSGCGNRKHGLMISDWGEYYLIQPEQTKIYNNENSKHIIQKRSTERIHDQHTCIFDASSDPYPNDILENRMHNLMDTRKAVMKNGDMTIELAVFADDALWRHFLQLHHQNADAELHKFILAAVNNIDILFTQRSIEPHIDIRVVRYQVMKSPPRTMAHSSHSSGDVDRLLDAFCEFQHSINPPSDDDPRHWDHALLFSGYDLYRDGLKTVAGYAPVKGMCSGQRSCTINEGLDFGSVFVVTHEMGHSLGMYHDGDNECDLRCCIMSPSVGSGKTRWSHCSVNEMSSFLGRLGSEFRPPNCLLDYPVEEQDMIFTDKDNPGQIFTLDEQCEIFHGECWKHELKDGQRLQDVCSIVWCGNGEGIIRTAHPALEGSYCGPGKQCRSGVCVPSYRNLLPVHGGWSEWNDSPGSSCGGQCLPCQIQGQIRIRRSIRQCNLPSPNNGGQSCYGDEARGLRCEREVCRGVSQEQYATNICTKLRDDPAVPNPQLTGQGTQFEQALCKVWCLLTLSNNIRTVANFPDGTPCGYQRFCIKGECRPVLCSGSVISTGEENCPLAVRPSTPNPMHSTAPSIQSNSITDTPESRTQFSVIMQFYLNIVENPFWKQWSGWSLWSQCISYNCEARGYRVRARRCFAGRCDGSSREREACTPPPCPNSSTATPPTTQQAFKYSTRVWTWTTTTTPLPSTTPRARTISTIPPTRLIWHPRTTTTTTWRPWTTTTTWRPYTTNSPWRSTTVSTWRPSATTTPSWQSRQSTPTWRPATTASTWRPFSTKSTWRAFVSTTTAWSMFSTTTTPTPRSSNTIWTQWSGCSVSCGSGMRLRRQKNCNQNCVQYEKCEMPACAPPRSSSWTGWSEWSTCSVTCGHGVQLRKRDCQGKSCKGPDSQGKKCAQAKCKDGWTEWSDWSSCSASCGPGKKNRKRLCYAPPCEGDDSNTQTCELKACWVWRRPRSSGGDLQKSTLARLGGLGVSHAIEGSVGEP
ncbi:unnamed protein product [Auanema sp. JU1783]|nr:unnamed protein product [Auanema sp. JU1783]